MLLLPLFFVIIVLLIQVIKAFNGFSTIDNRAANLILIILLAPVFILGIAGITYQTANVELPNVQTEIVGLFNRKTIFEVLCEVVKK